MCEAQGALESQDGLDLDFSVAAAVCGGSLFCPRRRPSVVGRAWLWPGLPGKKLKRPKEQGHLRKEENVSKAAEGSLCQEPQWDQCAGSDPGPVLSCLLYPV